jgi:hypothetical protein
MATYSWLDVTLPNPTTTELAQRLPTQIQTSPFTGATRTIARNGGFWEYTLSWRNVSGVDRQRLLGFFTRLHGAEHRVRLPLFQEPQNGNWGGTPLTNGATTSGHSVAINGASASVTDWAIAGDIFRFASSNRLRMVTANADSDAGGNVTLEFWPPIVEAVPDNNVIVEGPTLNAITGLWILASPVSFTVRDELASGELTSDLTLTFIDDVLGE